MSEEINDVFEKVKERDSSQCVICQAKKDIYIHYIVEKVMFDNIMNDINNLTILCEDHRHKAFTTELSCEEIREAAGIEEVIIPLYLDENERYDHWANKIVKEGYIEPSMAYLTPLVRDYLKEGGVKVFNEDPLDKKVFNEDPLDKNIEELAKKMNKKEENSLNFLNIKN